MKDLLLRERPQRAAEIERLFASQPREVQQTAEEIRAYYAPEQVERRANVAYADAGAVLVRESLDWATEKGMFVLPLVIERSHLMARDVFSATEMAIALLLRPPRLTIAGGKARLDVELRDQSYGIYNNTGKKFLAEYYLDDYTKGQLRALGREIHRTLISGDSRGALEVPLSADVEAIPYRWASGGILPIVRWRGRWWCALFWRDIRPIGWNIANGASENKEEYKDLDRLIWREAREELVILGGNPLSTQAGRRPVITRYLVPDDPDVPQFGDELAHHHRLRAEHDKWRLVYPQEWNPHCAVPATSLPGPHSVRIQYHQSPDRRSETREVHGVVLSINPLEFGIEVTRVVHFDLQDDDYLVDGEVLEAHGARPHLIRRPVALIDLSALHHAWRSRGTLGEDVDGNDFLEGRRVDELTAGDVEVFDADIRVRRALHSPMARQWNNRFGVEFDHLLQERTMPMTLKTLCPVTWRVLELAFKTGMLDADGPARRVPEGG